MQHSKEGLPNYSKEPLENRSERQPRERQLPQPEVAEHVHDIIDFVRKGLKRTPQYVDAAVDFLLDGQTGFVSYNKGDGNDDRKFRYLVDLRTYSHKDINQESTAFIETRRYEELTFEKQTKDTRGEMNRTWRMRAWSDYQDGQPITGCILINDKGENTATSVNAAWDFFRAEFPEPQPQTPQQQ
jgi:hypothetical protein